MDYLINKLSSVGKIPDLPDGVEFKLHDEAWVEVERGEVSQQITAVQQERLESLSAMIKEALKKYRPIVKGLAFLQKEE